MAYMAIIMCTVIKYVVVMRKLGCNIKISSTIRSHSYNEKIF